MEGTVRGRCVIRADWHSCFVLPHANPAKAEPPSLMNRPLRMAHTLLLQFFLASSLNKAV